MEDKSYYSEDIEQVIQSLQTDQEKGLSNQEATKRLEKYGKNVVEDKKKKSQWIILLEQFSNPIIWILVIAAGLAFAFQHIVEGVAVLAVIVINTLIGFFMERQALRSMEELKNMARSRTMILRDGKKSEIDSIDIVPGDILFLKVGDVITADARLISQNNLALKEAALTGESTQVQKKVEPLSEDTQVADRLNSVFKGTIVSRGNGTAVVVATGSKTELGKITEMAEGAEKEATPLNKKLKELSKRLIWLTLFVAGVILLTGVLRGVELVLMIETSIALAIASIPEGLPVISTLSLARGMFGLSKKNVIVKTLEAVQTLGETEVIFTDKTGTLTENEMRVHGIAFDEAFEKINDRSDKLKKHPEFDLFLKVGVLCNNSAIKTKDGKDKTTGDPEEVALLRMAKDLGVNVQEINNEFPRVKEIPFDSDIKMMATVHQSADEFLICVKGAMEETLKKCVSEKQNGEVKDHLDREKWSQKADDLANEGLRVLAFAYRTNKKKPEEDKIISDLIFLGLAGFIDPARPDVKGSIEDCRKAGIKVVMVTGDHPGTANAIAKEVGLAGEKEIVTVHGKDLRENMDDEEAERIVKANVFARVDPAQKLDLVSIYQKKKIVVGMTGDGVNDAPALKKADIGIAMGIRGTEAAKEAADLVINDDAFTSIVTAIKYGRVIFDNIRMFVIYLLSCNLSEIMIVAIASFFDLPMPLLPLQILFLNMITDVFPALAIGMNKGEVESVMKRPPRKSSEPIVSKSNWISITVYSLCLTAGVIGAELYAMNFLNVDDNVINNITFFTLILAQLWNVLNMPDREVSFFKNQITKNKYIWYALILCISITVIIYLVPPVRSALAIVSINPSVLVLIVAASLSPIVLVQLFKRGFKIIE